MYLGRKLELSEQRRTLTCKRLQRRRTVRKATHMCAQGLSKASIDHPLRIRARRPNEREPQKSWQEGIVSTSAVIIAWSRGVKGNVESDWQRKRRSFKRLVRTVS